MATLGGSARRNPRGADFKRLSVGGGNLLYKIRSVTASVNPASLAATTKAGTAVTITGVATGDFVIAVPPAALEDDLIFTGARVTAADEVTVYIYNPTAGAIDAAAADWDFLVFELS